MAAAGGVQPLVGHPWIDAGEQAIHNTAVQNGVQPYVVSNDGIPDEGTHIWLYTFTDGLVEGPVTYPQDADLDPYVDSPQGPFDLFGSMIYFYTDPNVPLAQPAAATGPVWTATSLQNAPNVGNIQVSNTNLNGIGLDAFVDGEEVYKLNTHVFKRPGLNAWWNTITQQRQHALANPHLGLVPGEYRNPTTGVAPAAIEKGVARILAAAAPAAPAIPTGGGRRRQRRKSMKKRKTHSHKKVDLRRRHRTRDHKV